MDGSVRGCFPGGPGCQSWVGVPGIEDGLGEEVEGSEEGGGSARVMRVLGSGCGCCSEGV